MKAIQPGVGLPARRGESSSDGNPLADRLGRRGSDPAFVDVLDQPVLGEAGVGRLQAAARRRRAPAAGAARPHPCRARSAALADQVMDRRRGSLDLFVTGFATVSSVAADSLAKKVVCIVFAVSIAKPTSFMRRFIARILRTCAQARAT